MKIITQNKIKDQHQNNPFNDSISDLYIWHLEELRDLRKFGRKNNLIVNVKGVREIDTGEV